MAREILNAAVVQQFKRYLKKKGKDFDKLTKEEVKSEGINFLKDMYTGAEKPPPPRAPSRNNLLSQINAKIWAKIQ